MASNLTTAGLEFLTAAVAGVKVLSNNRIADQIILAHIPQLDYTQTPPADSLIPDNVVDTLTISGYASTNRNNSVFTAIADSGAGDYTFNWLGLYNSEHDVLIQVAYEPEQVKYSTVNDEIGNVIAKSMVLEIDNAAAAFDMNEPAQSWQVDFTGRQRAAEALQRNAMRQVYGSGTYVLTAGQVTKSASVYQVAEGAAMIDGLQVQIPATDTAIESDTAPENYPFYIYATVAQSVTASSVENTIEIETSQNTLDNYTDKHGQVHARVLLATLDDENTITDNREYITDDLNNIRNAKENVIGQTRYATKEEHEQRAEKEAAATPGGVDELISKMFAGQVANFPGTVPPSGWLIAKGQTVNRADYPYLWEYAQNSNNIAATEGEKTDGKFGPGDGSTTFSLPDLRGVHIRNWDDSKGTDSGRDIGTNQSDQNKAHSHTTSTSFEGNHGHSATVTSNGSHTHTATASTDGSHTHTINTWDESTSQSGVAYGTSSTASSASTNSAGDHNHTITVNSAGSHSHTVSLNNNGGHAHTVTVGNDGGTETRVKNIALLACIKY